jgi:hypothetical protein
MAIVRLQFTSVRVFIEMLLGYSQTMRAAKAEAMQNRCVEIISDVLWTEEKYW